MKNSLEPQGGERVYRKPELKVLGDLAKLTNTAGARTRYDNAYYGIGTHT
jgi:hypothetical protein